MSPTPPTLGAALQDIARRQPHKLAVCGARSLSWAALRDEVEQVAGGLAALGVGPGDTVALCLSRRVELVVAFLAVARLGAVVLPVNHKLHHGHLASLFAVARPVLIVCEPRFEAVLGELGAEVPWVTVGPSPRPAAHPWATLRGTPPADATQAHSLCYYNVTSGSTGAPRCAQASHAAVLANADATIAGLDFRPDDVFLCMFSSFSHPHELFHRALRTGASVVLLDTLSPRVVAQAVARHRVSWMMAVPSFYEMLAEHLDRLGPLDSLRVLEAGGAWSRPGTAAQLEAALGCRYLSVWGSTETNGVVLSAGQVCPGYQVALRDPRGRPVADGEVGELWVRGPGLCQGYLDQAQASAQVFVDGWYRTGDLMRFSGGHFDFVGRHSELLKVGGVRVYPAEIERVLLDHPEVLEAVVVRAEERVRGEVPHAVVQVLPGAGPDAATLQRWCRARLASYAVPRQITLTHELPRLPNGKVDRQALR